MTESLVFVGEHGVSALANQPVSKRVHPRFARIARENFAIDELVEARIHARFVTEQTAHTIGGKRVAEDACRSEHTTRVGTERAEPALDDRNDRRRRVSTPSLGFGANELL